MLTTIALIHRVLGETMLLVALVGVGLAVAGLVRKKELESVEGIFGMAYAGLLDLQALLGIVYFFLLPAGGRPTLLHPALMILAVIVVHASRRWRDSSSPTRHRAQLGAYGLSLILIFVGRMLIA